MLVALVQRDARARSFVTETVEAAGHVVVALPCGSWLAPLLRRRPMPDVVVLDREARGYERALDALDDSDFDIPVLAPWPLRAADERALSEEAAEHVLRDLERAIRRE